MHVLEKIQVDLDNMPKGLDKSAYELYKEQVEMFHIISGRAFFFFNRCFKTGNDFGPTIK